MADLEARIEVQLDTEKALKQLERLKRDAAIKESRGTGSAQNRREEENKEKRAERKRRGTRGTGLARGVVDRTAEVKGQLTQRATQAAGTLVRGVPVLGPIAGAGIAAAGAAAGFALTQGIKAADLIDRLGGPDLIKAIVEHAQFQDAISGPINAAVDAASAGFEASVIELRVKLNAANTTIQETQQLAKTAGLFGWRVDAKTFGRFIQDSQRYNEQIERMRRYSDKAQKRLFIQNMSQTVKQGNKQQ